MAGDLMGEICLFLSRNNGVGEGCACRALLAGKALQPLPECLTLQSLPAPVLQVRQVRPAGETESWSRWCLARKGGGMEGTDTRTLCAELDPTAWPAGRRGPLLGAGL